MNKTHEARIIADWQTSCPQLCYSQKQNVAYDITSCQIKVVNPKIVPFLLFHNSCLFLIDRFFDACQEEFLVVLKEIVK